jgi:CelD/BcsL family acetyltransferase involved in cellulose biosynthesis
MPSSVAESTLGPLELEEIRPGALTASDLTRWRAFLAANPDLRSPFFAPEFTRIAGEIAPHARVAVLHRRGEIAGFLPFQRRGATLQPLAAPLNDYQGVIAPPQDRPELDALLRLLGVGGAWVTGWIGPAGSVTGLCPASAALADLSAGWDDYLARQSLAHPKFFRDKGRVRRRIETAFKRCAVTDDDQDEAGLSELVKLKRRQLHRTGQHDIFRCGWTQDILAALLAQPRSGLHARIATLRLDDQVAGYELSLAADAMQHFWIPAYDPEFAAHSPGMLLSLDTMQARRAQGVTLFDLGSGPERYKTYFANAARPVLTGFAYRPEGIASPLMAGDRVGKLRRRWAVIEACGDYASGLSRGAGAMLRLSRARVRGAVDDHHRS